MEMEKYEFKEKIGAGSYGEVYKAVEKATNRIIAIKLIKKKPNPTDRERKEQKKFLKECNIHNSLSHPNIIQMLGSFETIDHIVVATELAGIDLHQFMREQRLTEKQVQKLTWNLISALYYLHSQRVLHRDLKPQNILLNNYQNIDEMEAKLCDFGLAKKITSETYLLTSVKGTPLYMAPEVIRDGVYDERADLWSLGCIIYQANFRTPPFDTKSFTQLIKWLGNPEIVWQKPITTESKSFVDGLLKKDPKMRLTWPQIIDHPYVKDNLIILDVSTAERPLTQDLTTSQMFRKEKQRGEINLNRNYKMITEGMKKYDRPKTKQNTTGICQVVERRRPSNVIGDNESISSDDSINAIIQTDLETDVEGPLIKKKPKPRADIEHNDNTNQNLVIKRYIDNFAGVAEVAGEREEKDNANLKIGTMIENMEKMQLEDESKWTGLKAKPAPPQQTLSALPAAQYCDNRNVNNGEKAPCAQSKANTDLIKRKLSQNLENFSIRLGKDLPTNDKTSSESDKNPAKPKTDSVIASAEKNAAENTDKKVDNCEIEQSPPIENEEWQAFIQLSMQELLNGENDSLKNQNLVGFIVTILRNFNASSKVIGSVVQLLSVPFVLPMSNDDIATIKTVFAHIKIVPNLIVASKIICMVKSNNPRFSSTYSSSNCESFGNETVAFKKMSELSLEQMKTLSSIYELVCYLVHQSNDFLIHFCESDIIANDLLRHLLSDVVYDSQGMQIVCAIVSILSYVLRETPEYAETVETVIFHENVNLMSLFQNGNDPLKSRLCTLMRIVGRFCSTSLRNIWTREFRQTIECLVDGSNAKVKEDATETISELKSLPFYSV